MTTHPVRSSHEGQGRDDHSVSALRVERCLPDGFLAEALRADARAGLTASPKVLPPKWFYDERGSELFEKITHLDEYYPTRVERSILREYAGQIAAATRARTLVELGAGAADKTRLLLDALREEGTLASFVPVDVSEAALIEAAHRVEDGYPGLSVTPSSPISRNIWACPTLTGPGWSRFSAAPSATCCRISGRSSSPRCARGCNRQTRSCSAPTWSRTPGCLSPPTTTRRG